MTIDEAHIFLPVAEGETLIDAYDEQVFSYKQDFMSKAPIRKVFVAKLKKMRRVQEAYELLADAPPTTMALESPVFQFSPVIREAFNMFHQERSKCMQRIAMARTLLDIEVVVNVLLDLVDAYRKCWYTEVLEDIEVNAISKEMDPMELLKAIGEFEALGGRTFDDLIQSRNHDVLLTEMKRVSLLLKIQE